MEGGVHNTIKLLYQNFVALRLGFFGHVNTLNQECKQVLRQIFDHVIHLNKELIRSEHVSVFLAYFLEALKH